MDNIAILKHTLQILKQGKYQTSENTEVNLKLSSEQMKSATVILPENVNNIIKENTSRKIPYVLGGRCIK